MAEHKSKNMDTTVILGSPNSSDIFYAQPDKRRNYHGRHVMVVLDISRSGVDLCYSRHKYILLLPTLTLVGFISLNIYSGYSVAEGIKRERANARIHLMDAGGAEIMGVLILPVANGIVYIPSDLCEPPDDQMIHFISWEAIKLVEDIAERNCASSDDQVRPPKT
jgi:hypothetical protein